MNKIIFPALAFTVLAACNNSGPVKTENAKVEQTAQSTDPATAAPASKPADTADVKPIIAAYLQMKNAFTKDNSKEAAAAANKLKDALGAVHTESLDAQKLKAFNTIREDATEHAEHISSNAGKLAHQREHFDMLSDNIYTLVKTFGAGQTLYYDHCPMYNDGKGGDWLSETKTISNPFYGKAMATCGSVKEELK